MAIEEETVENVDKAFLRFIGFIALVLCLAGGTLGIVWVAVTWLEDLPFAPTAPAAIRLLVGSLLLYGVALLIGSRLPPAPPEPERPAPTPQAYVTYLLAIWAGLLGLTAAYAEPDYFIFGGGPKERGLVLLLSIAAFGFAVWNIVAVARHRRSGSPDVGDGWRGWLGALLMMSLAERAIKSAPWPAIGWTLAGLVLIAGLLQFALTRIIGRSDARTPRHP